MSTLRKRQVSAPCLANLVFVAVAILLTADVVEADTFTVACHDLRGRLLDGTDSDRPDVILEVYEQQLTSPTSDSPGSYQLNAAFRVQAIREIRTSGGRASFSIDPTELEGDENLLLVVARRIGVEPTAIVPFIAVVGNQTHSLTIAVPVARPTYRPRCPAFRDRQGFGRCLSDDKGASADLPRLGDVVAPTEETYLYLGYEKLASVGKNHRLIVSKIDDDWLATSVLVNGEPRYGWLWAGHVRVASSTDGPKPVWRTWTSSNGNRTTSARFMCVRNGKAYFRANDGRQKVAHLQSLSNRDRSLVEWYVKNRATSL